MNAQTRRTPSPRTADAAAQAASGGARDAIDRRTLADEAATLALGGELASWGLVSEIVGLRGDLGAGKTTLTRGFLRALGHQGTVKSPTYTLLETYALPGARVLHFDFYRIDNARELDYIGIDELLAEPAVKLVEWPERAGNKLPLADIDVHLALAGNGRHVEVVDRR